MERKVKPYSIYKNIKQFIQNDLHVELSIEQTQRLKCMLDVEVQEKLKELYKESNT